MRRLIQSFSMNNPLLHGIAIDLVMALCTGFVMSLNECCNHAGRRAFAVLDRIRNIAKYVILAVSGSITCGAFAQDNSFVLDNHTMSGYVFLVNENGSIEIPYKITYPDSSVSWCTLYISQTKAADFLFTNVEVYDGTKLVFSLSETHDTDGKEFAWASDSTTRLTIDMLSPDPVKTQELVNKITTTGIEWDIAFAVLDKVREDMPNPAGADLPEGSPGEACGPLCRLDYPVPNGGDCDGIFDGLECCRQEATYDVCRRVCECFFLSPLDIEYLTCDREARNLFLIEYALCYTLIPGLFN